MQVAQVFYLLKNQKQYSPQLQIKEKKDIYSWNNSRSGIVKALASGRDA